MMFTSVSAVGAYVSADKGADLPLCWSVCLAVCACVCVCVCAHMCVCTGTSWEYRLNLTAGTWRTQTCCSLPADTLG